MTTPAPSGGFARHCPTLAKHLPAFLKWLRLAVFAFVCVATLLALVITEENIRTKHAWDNFKRAAEARGEKFALSEFASPPVPDDQNFFMSPLLQPLSEPHSNDASDNAANEYWLKNSRRFGDRLNPYQSEMETSLPGQWASGERANLENWKNYSGQNNLQEALQPYAAVMEEISAASRRPAARFADSSNSFGNPAIFDALDDLSNLFTLRALLAVEAGQGDRACADALTIFRVADALSNQPSMYAYGLNLRIRDRGLQVVWEGLAAHCWNDPQLTALQQELEKTDLIASARLALQGERASLTVNLEKIAGHPDELARILPALLGLPYPREPNPWTPLASRALALYDGLIYANLLEINRSFEEQYFPLLDVAAHRIDPQVVAESIAKNAAQFAPGRHPFLQFAQHLCSMTPSFGADFAYIQVSQNLASVACALERFRLAHGQYPDSLDALVPQFIAQLPHDVISGGPLHYQRTADGRFLLYSVGWNETDDHGNVVKGKDGEIDYHQGDWVWPFPSP